MQLLQTQLPSGLAVLTSMITPAVMLSACGSLIIATQSRLNRGVDRSRELLQRFLELSNAEEDAVVSDAEVRVLYQQLDYSTSRSRILQHALAGLYFSAGAFVATSVAIAFVTLTGFGYAAPIALGITAAGLLLYSTLVLVRESRIALAALRAEMDYVWEQGKSHAPEELIQAGRRDRARRRLRPWLLASRRG